jgi:hypothetical protein
LELVGQFQNRTEQARFAMRSSIVLAGAAGETQNGGLRDSGLGTETAQRQLASRRRD